MCGKKFAVLLCAEDTEFVKKTYGGYFGVFLRMLAEEGETWDLYRVARGEFPDDDEIESFDGFVISGSSRDAHGNDAWICRLLTLLQKLDSIKKKVLGICFGHQQRRSHSGVNGVARPLGSHGNNLRGPLELLVRPLGAAGATSWSCTPRVR